MTLVMDFRAFEEDMTEGEEKSESKALLLTTLH